MPCRNRGLIESVINVSLLSTSLTRLYIELIKLLSCRAYIPSLLNHLDAQSFRDDGEKK